MASNSCWEIPTKCRYDAYYSFYTRGICSCPFHIQILPLIKDNFCFDLDSNCGQIQESSLSILTFIYRNQQKSKLIFIIKIVKHKMVDKLRTSTDFLQIKAFMHSSLQDVQSFIYKARGHWLIYTKKTYCLSWHCHMLIWEGTWHDTEFNLSHSY